MEHDRSPQSDHTPFEEIAQVAQVNFNRLAAIIPWITSTRAVERIVLDNASPKSKLRKLVALYESLGQAAAAVSPCKAGCSYCCHIPVVISTQDAERIARATSRVPKTLPLRSPIELDRILKSHTPSPCPFLKESRCSIYDDRPLACRTHYTLDNSSYWCNPNVGVNQAVLPKADDLALNLSYIEIATALKISFGEIREFFPAE